MDPPNISVAYTGTLTHAGAAGTTQADTILAAPGAGMRYRVWWVTLTRVGAAGAGSPLLEGNLRWAGSEWGMAGLGSGTWAEHYTYPGGVRDSNGNRTLLWVWRAVAAAGTTVKLAVGYTLEAG